MTQMNQPRTARHSHVSPVQYTNRASFRFDCSRMEVGDRGVYVRSRRVFGPCSRGPGNGVSEPGRQTGQNAHGYKRVPGNRIWELHADSLPGHRNTHAHLTAIEYPRVLQNRDQSRDRPHHLGIHSLLDESGRREDCFPRLPDQRRCASAPAVAAGLGDQSSLSANSRQQP